MKEKREEKEKKEIIIPVPKNKRAIIIENQDGVQIIWQEKELTWDIIRETLKEKRQFIDLPYIVTNDTERKTNLFIKLINIRNYFGKPDKSHTGYVICHDNLNNPFIAQATLPYILNWSKIAFEKKEHAEQALKILGKDIKYLSTPW